MTEKISKAEAKRRINDILERHRFGAVPAEDTDEVHQLVAIAYPNGIPLPRL